MGLLTAGAAILFFTASNSDWRAAGQLCVSLSAFVYSMGIKRGPLTRWDFQQGLLAGGVILLLGGTFVVFRNRLPWNRDIFRCGLVVLWIGGMAMLAFSWRQSRQHSNPYTFLTRT
ncbi:MAG TPA: hypothetical protein VMB21_16075 [Candidatus Limnocylindria bacterium]|nr:hypothetical protein [Candidatus Limnocylindria bacterium]